MINRITLLLFIGLAYCQDITVAVYDFENNGLDDSQVRQITSRLESELEKVGVKFVERKQIDDLMKEQKLQMTGIVNDDDLVQMGTMLGATHVLLGSVGKMTDTYYTITAKLVATGSGELKKSANYDADNGLIDLIKNGLPNIAQTLLEIKYNDKPSERFEITIGNVYIGDGTFTRSMFGNPLNIKLVVFEDQVEVLRVNLGKVRGIVGVNKKVPIDLKLNSVYKMVIVETDGVLTNNRSYTWTATWEGLEENEQLLTEKLDKKILKFSFGDKVNISLGGKVDSSKEWFFNKGKLKFGNNSYIEVSQVLKN